MKKLIFFSVLILGLSAQPVDSSMDGKFLIGGDLGVTFTSSDYNELGSGLMLRGIGEYILSDKNDHIFGLRGYGAYGISSGSDSRYTPEEFSTNLYMISAGAIYAYKFSNRIIPYAYLGLRFIRFNPKDSEGHSLPSFTNEDYDRNIFNLAIEFGLRYKFSEQLYGYSSLNPISVTNDNIDARNSGSGNDYVVSLNFGLLYSFETPWSDAEDIPEEELLPEGLDERSRIPENESEVEETFVPDDESVELETENAGENIDVVEVDKEADLTEVEKTGANIVDELSTKLGKGIVNFEFGETELDRMEYVELDRLYDLISGSKSKWKIIGHTDSIEPSEVHQSLAIQRAYFVLRYFMGKGIDREKFEIVVAGKDEPLAENSTPEGRAKNRRVEIIKKK